jgi:hypothetical protein
MLALVRKAGLWKVFAENGEFSGLSIIVSFSRGKIHFDRQIDAVFWDQLIKKLFNGVKVLP